jgi:hypothetical protein
MVRARSSTRSADVVEGVLHLRLVPALMPREQQAPVRQVVPEDQTSDSCACSLTASLGLLSPPSRISGHARKDATPSRAAAQWPSPHLAQALQAVR